MIQLFACRTVLAWAGITPINKMFTVSAGKAVGTSALVESIVVDTGAAVLARARVTLVDAELTIGASVSRRAATRVRIDAVNAGASVHARTHSAVFIIGLAVDA